VRFKETTECTSILFPKMVSEKRQLKGAKDEAEAPRADGMEVRTKNALVKRRGEKGSRLTRGGKRVLRGGNRTVVESTSWGGGAASSEEGRREL